MSNIDNGFLRNNKSSEDSSHSSQVQVQVALLSASLEVNNVLFSNYDYHEQRRMLLV